MHPKVQTRFEDPTSVGMSDDTVDQMLVLADRLRAANGELDDAAIVAVAEAVGAPVEHVRLAIRLRATNTPTSALEKVRANYLSLEPEVRRNVAIGALAVVTAFLIALGNRTGIASYGIFGMLAMVSGVLAVYGIAIARDAKRAAISGAIFGGGMIAATAVFSLLLRLPAMAYTTPFAFWTVVGAAAGAGLQTVFGKVRDRLGMKDPVQERQDLLRQLVQIQDKLKSGEQSMTFLSIDIVGSTRMKAEADPLAVEFTFNEYHRFVEMVVRKYGGRVHSTAGDGVTCAFDHPQQAFSAARNLQAGLIELNTFRNRIGVPIRLRCGVHTGTVMAPDAEDVTSVNFSQVIDIAAHLQKVCPEGGVAISEAAAMYLAGGPNAVGSVRVAAMNVPAVVWSPRRAEKTETGSAPPPLPEQV